MVPWYLSDGFLFFCLGSILGYAIRNLYDEWNKVEPTFDIPCSMHSNTTSTPYQPFRAVRLTDAELATAMEANLGSEPIPMGIRYKEGYIPSFTRRPRLQTGPFRGHTGTRGYTGYTGCVGYRASPPLNEFWNKYLKSE